MVVVVVVVVVVVMVVVVVVKIYELLTCKAQISTCIAVYFKKNIRSVKYFSGAAI